MKEKELVNSCLELLTLKKIFHYRNNTGAFSTSTGGFYRFGTVGSSDIVAVINGKFVGIECKVSKNSQSENQKTFQKDLELAGGIYWLIRNIDDLINNLNHLN